MSAGKTAIVVVQQFICIVMPADKNSYVCCFNILSEWISADKKQQ